ncbi:hypothetical protein MMC25_006827 [Agyrium rufum]|nr:hypothetical protein [Agyrium rufum]
MSYALSTTKRKFTRLLDSISNASDTSLDKLRNTDCVNLFTSTLPATHETPSKRRTRQIPRPISAYTSSSIPIGSSVRGKDVAHQYHSNPGITQRKPHFTPWDRSAFLERLESFRHVDKWMSKPDEVNEVKWAKRGWSCVGKERVACKGCGEEIVVDLETSPSTSTTDRQGNDENGNPEDGEEEEDWKLEAREKLVRKHEELIIVGHTSSCLWRVRGCDETIQKLQLSSSQAAIQALKQRYDSLIAVATELPTDLELPDTLSTKHIGEQFAKLVSPTSTNPTTIDIGDNETCHDISSSDRVDQPINLDALSLAIFGWQSEKGHMAGIVTCTSCFRRLGLWLFKKPSNIGVKVGTDEEAVMNCLDVVTEHRDYCPWVNADAQSGRTKASDKVGNNLDVRGAGWEVLSRVLESSHAIQLHRARERDQLMEPTTRTEEQVRESLDDALTEISTVNTNDDTLKEDDAKDRKDQERWAKLKRLKRVFSVKKIRESGKENTEGRRPRTAG